MLNLKEILRRNGYPLSVIDKEMETFLNAKFSKPCEQPDHVSEPNTDKKDKKKIFLVYLILTAA